MGQPTQRSPTSIWDSPPRPESHRSPLNCADGSDPVGLLRSCPRRHSPSYSPTSKARPNCSVASARTITPQSLADHHALIRSGLKENDGKEVNTQGDGFFAVFASPSACVRAAIEIQRALGAHRWPAGERVRVRMGVHAGEASERTTGLVGLEVHRVNRVAAIAHGGQILVSTAAAALVQDSLPAGATLRDLGFHRLKDLGRPEHIFQLEAEGIEAEFSPPRSLDNPALQNNLPAQSARFIGRQRELAEVQRLVESARLVTLTGAGGCGKTRARPSSRRRDARWFR